MRKYNVLRDLLEAPEFQKSKAKLAFAVGKDIAGKVIVADIAKMPHLLVAVQRVLRKIRVYQYNYYESYLQSRPGRCQIDHG